MTVIKFPPVDSADENGLLALGGDLELGTLELAYRSGIFPWPISEDFPLAWFSPDPRGILEFHDLKINKRLQRLIKNSPLQIYCNRHFSEVIHNCSKIVRKNQSGTWITKEIINGYESLFDHHLAYSLEAYLEDKLVAGIYGVCFGGIVSGESMFHKESNSSKICLFALMVTLQKAGISWLDTQMVTPVVQQMGGKEIARDHFISRLKKAAPMVRHQIFPHHLQLTDLLDDYHSQLSKEED